MRNRKRLLSLLLAVVLMLGMFPTALAADRGTRQNEDELTWDNIDCVLTQGTQLGEI